MKNEKAKAESELQKVRERGGGGGEGEKRSAQKRWRDGADGADPEHLKFGWMIQKTHRRSLCPSESKLKPVIHFEYLYLPMRL